MEPGNDYVKCFKNSQAIVVSENQYKSQLHLSCPHNYHILLYQSFKRLYNIFLIFFANNQRHTRWKPFVNVFAYTCLEIAVGGTKTNFWTSTTLADFFRKCCLCEAKRSYSKMARCIRCEAYVHKECFLVDLCKEDDAKRTKVGSPRRADAKEFMDTTNVEVDDREEETHDCIIKRRKRSGSQNAKRLRQLVFVISERQCDERLQTFYHFYNTIANEGKFIFF
ncbi:uncharacterized protein LOC112690717 [Sipha flava]|uniref:Uncharacterized protein LOC112690717 n=1 Tax=Sipha flava TaxID=143950 RepID=A0A8B8GCC1_9HEMI|nr:uncharacterized protein LOC112690717 [Sipha flava]